jgi:hypothetical protein
MAGQADWRKLVPLPVMEKFAASEGGVFPAPQYSQGMTMVLQQPAPTAAAAAAAGGGGGDGSKSNLLRGSGVVLLGDSAHSFPPDLGKCY